MSHLPPSSPAAPTSRAAHIDAIAGAIVSIGSGRRRASGFVWQPGLVVTADEPLPERGPPMLTFNDASRRTASIVGRDPATDIALLRVETGAVAELGWAAPPRTGETVTLVGADEAATIAGASLVALSAGPWRSLRNGLIDRRLELSGGLDPRSEGGLALDSAGRAFGMSVAGPRGRTLAIPAATIDRVATLLRDHGQVPRGYLGLALQPVRIDATGERGLIAIGVAREGPGAAAGFHQGDVIARCNDDSLAGARALQRWLDAEHIGDILTFDILRGGERHRLELVVGVRPAADA